MRRAMESLLDGQKPRLNSCPECPVKGACVFATPGYEPGYCLHEFKLLHAFVSRHLRGRAPAGVERFEWLQVEAARFVDRMKRESAYGRLPQRLPDSRAWPNQTTLARFT